MLKEKIVKYMSVMFLVGFFIFITIVGLRDCDKPGHKHNHFHRVLVEEPYVLVDDIIFEVFMGDDYEEVD